MSARATSPIEDASQALLRWFVAADTRPREVVVKLIEITDTKAILGCTTQIPEKTKVYLIGKNYTASAVVNSCVSHESAFRLLLEFSGHRNTDLATPFDPGVLHVEEWLSEEAEAQILKDLENELR